MPYAVRIKTTGMYGAHSDGCEKSGPYFFVQAGYIRRPFSNVHGIDITVLPVIQKCINRFRHFYQLARAQYCA